MMLVVAIRYRLPLACLFIHRKAEISVYVHPPMKKTTVVVMVSFPIPAQHQQLPGSNRLTPVYDFGLLHLVHCLAGDRGQDIFETFPAGNRVSLRDSSPAPGVGFVAWRAQNCRLLASTLNKTYTERRVTRVNVRNVVRRCIIDVVHDETQRFA